MISPGSKNGDENLSDASIVIPSAKDKKNNMDDIPERDSDSSSLSEQRKKQYHDQILSRITQSAKKKQSEQQDIWRQIESEIQLKKQESSDQNNSEGSVEHELK